MCQLTFLHGQTPFVKAVLGNLTLMNSAGNKDGHGFYFPPPIKKYYKTKLSGGAKVFDDDYWKRIENCVDDLEEVAVMSHVRSASINQKIINVENAHPFHVGSIILMHNGTLEPDDATLEIEDRIDSYWYTKRLANIVGRKHLKPEHISKAMEDFRGKFAFLIADTKQPDIVYIVKGKSANLGYANFIDSDGKPVCFAVNTMKKNLETIALPMFWRAIKSQDVFLEDDPKDLEDESIYIYDIPTGSLTLTDVEIKERATLLITPPINANRDAYMHMGFRGTDSRSNSSYSSASSDGRVVYELSLAANEMMLSFSELNHIFLLMHGCSLLYATEFEIRKTAEFVDKLRKTWKSNTNKKKIKLWKEATEEFSSKSGDFPLIGIYEISSKFRFPWFLNSAGGLKNVRSRVKEWNNHGAKIS